MIGGCGGDDGDDGPEGPLGPSVRVAVAQLQDAFESDDIETICALTTTHAAEEAGKMGHGTPKTCQRDIQRAIRMIDRGGGWDARDTPRVVDVEGRGDRRTATVAVDSWEAEVPFVRTGRRWRLDSFFGIDRQRLTQAKRSARETPFPATGAIPVAVADADGSPCPNIASERYPSVSGGCGFRVVNVKTPIHMLTPFGNFKFGDCVVVYDVAVDRRGRAWTHNWEVAGPSNGCSDISQCVEPGTNEEQPWKGRLRSDGEGGYLHTMRMCLETCVGPYVGEYTVRLELDGDRRQARPAGNDVTGFQIQEHLAIRGKPFELRQRGPITVTVTPAGYEPDDITIEVGDRVHFVNRSPSPGSAMDESRGEIDVSPQPGATQHDGSEIAHATMRGFATHSLFEDERQTVVFEAARKYEYTSTYDDTLRGTITVVPRRPD